MIDDHKFEPMDCAVCGGPFDLHMKFLIYTSGGQFWKDGRIKDKTWMGWGKDGPQEDK